MAPANRALPIAPSEACRPATPRYRHRPRDHDSRAHLGGRLLLLARDAPGERLLARHAAAVHSTTCLLARRLHLRPLPVSVDSGPRAGAFTRGAVAGRTGRI